MSTSNEVEIVVSEARTQRAPTSHTTTSCTFLPKDRDGAVDKLKTALYDRLSAVQFERSLCKFDRLAGIVRPIEDAFNWEINFLRDILDMMEHS